MFGGHAFAAGTMGDEDRPILGKHRCPDAVISMVMGEHDEADRGYRLFANRRCDEPGVGRGNQGIDHQDGVRADYGSTIGAVAGVESLTTQRPDEDVLADLCLGQGTVHSSRILALVLPFLGLGTEFWE